MSGATDPDDELVRRAGQGDAAAVQALVARKLRRVLALAERMLGDAAEAEDVAQDAFFRVWRHAPRWRPGVAQFDTWLHRVTLNLCYDRLRGRRDEQPYDESLHATADPAPTPEHAMQALQRGERMAAALAALPTRQREAI